MQETRRRSSIEADDIAATFSATPPVEALRFVLSMAMTLQSDPPDPIVVKHIDNTRAHPHVSCKRELYVVPPKQMGFADKRIMELLKNLYGIRDAGQGFELFVAEVMVELLGYTQGTFNPCLFHHVDKGIRGICPWR